MNVELHPYWEQMSKKERIEHFHQVGDRLLEHRYRYYVLDAPVVDDFYYDHVEKYYRLMAATLNLPDTAVNMVDFDLKREDAQAAKARVDSETDYHSLWIKDMMPVWKKVGLSRKQAKSDLRKEFLKALEE